MSSKQTHPLSVDTRKIEMHPVCICHGCGNGNIFFLCTKSKQQGSLYQYPNLSFVLEGGDDILFPRHVQVRKLKQERGLESVKKMNFSSKGTYSMDKIIP